MAPPAVPSRADQVTLPNARDSASARLGGNCKDSETVIAATVVHGTPFRMDARNLPAVIHVVIGFSNHA